jgi:hypothetical protein
MRKSAKMQVPVVMYLWSCVLHMLNYTCISRLERARMQVGTRTLWSCMYHMHTYWTIHAQAGWRGRGCKWGQGPYGWRRSVAGAAAILRESYLSRPPGGVYACTFMCMCACVLWDLQLKFEKVTSTTLHTCVYTCVYMCIYIYIYIYITTNIWRRVRVQGNPLGICEIKY